MFVYIRLSYTFKNEMLDLWIFFFKNMILDFGPIQHLFYMVSVLSV